jgi:hypothetical protein
MTKTKLSRDIPKPMLYNQHKDFVPTLEQDMQAKSNQQQPKFAKAKHSHELHQFAFFVRKARAILLLFG